MKVSTSDPKTPSSLSQRAGRGLHRFALFTSFATWILIWAGGLVTSTDSGLAVPDWPLSYGMLMPPMIGGILYEHGHRMVATTVGLLTVALALWLWRSETRQWLRRLGAVALAMVTTQGILGGITVLYLLPTPVSVAHATLAQTFFCVTVLIAFATSREWQRAEPAPELPSSLRRLALVTTGAVYTQLVLGAVVRHTGAALSIPDFPLAFGRVIPPLTDPLVVIHFAHRTGAALVTVLSALLAFRVLRLRTSPVMHRLSRPVILLLALVALQILLGALTVWSQTAVVPATAHVATGALVLATTWLLSLRALLYVKRGSEHRVATVAATQEA